MPGPMAWLNDGHRMPKLGLGLWRVDDDAACAIVQEGIRAGYRSLDTAYLYRNEKGVGQGIARSGVPRETCLSPQNCGIPATATMKRLKRLTKAWSAWASNISICI